MHELPGRRKFVHVITKAAGMSLLMPGLSLGQDTALSQQSFTVGQIMDLIIKKIPGAPFPKTVDTLKSGSSSQKVTGIVSTMFATVEVIEKTISLGANFIIAHEPTFYNHADDTDWLESSDVFRYKRDLLKKNGIALWRFHDYVHSLSPDGIQAGMLAALGWKQYASARNLHVLTMPATPLSQLINHAKAKLGIKMVRVVGDPSQSCQRVLLMPGAAGGRSQITVIEKEKPDVIFCGESSEWETPEYVRDARRQGKKLSLVILGHIMSETAGMEWVASWLKPQLPGVKITYVPSGNEFTYL
ncbi:Nif3-like dinuclear metal center hexameric protein [Spirosoma pollinicola]|uniref:NGG1p interacting factor NIF3 n=1 Tax=Spirosoma pollinicola TaxID=2057025 RepID=A0A2K8Z248_9BACT|nr:Nif3-like dinuclear metal center hexameric protein [Spirosoma pollinicola]AUD03928.1 NGG1p interacting factor NIF3 [Spirosoma pollinicola]